jgi:hypothetical protein
MRDERWREEKEKKEGGVKSMRWRGEREREKKEVDDEKGIMALSLKKLYLFLSTAQRCSRETVTVT